MAVFGYAYELQEVPNHSINEHVDHVINMIKSLEVYIYIYIYILFMMSYLHHCFFNSIDTSVNNLQSQAQVSMWVEWDNGP